MENLKMKRKKGKNSLMLYFRLNKRKNHSDNGQSVMAEKFKIFFIPFHKSIEFYPFFISELKTVIRMLQKSQTSKFDVENMI